MPITKEKSFKVWMSEKFSPDELALIANKGAKEIAYFNDILGLHQLYKKYDVEIWHRINEQLNHWKPEENDQFSNIMSFCTYTYGAEVMEDPGAFECACVWEAARLYAIDFIIKEKCK